MIEARWCELRPSAGELVAVMVVGIEATGTLERFKADLEHIHS